MPQRHGLRSLASERDLRRRPAGIRTSMFVCLATALFTILSNELAHMWGDSGSTRIASNIVQGIGFLGAGAIIKDNLGMVGMTTAATIFVEAAIGMAVGAVSSASRAWPPPSFCLLSSSSAGPRKDSISNTRTILFRFTTSHAENVAAEVQRLLSELARSHAPVPHLDGRGKLRR